MLLVLARSASDDGPVTVMVMHVHLSGEYHSPLTFGHILGVLEIALLDLAIQSRYTVCLEGQVTRDHGE